VIQDVLEASVRTKISSKILPYGRQTITQEDIDAVTSVLQSDYLTQGPVVEKFEAEIARTVGARHAISCANGTAALHLALLALEIGVGNEIVTTPNTFVASANCARYVGAEVKFCDIDPATGLIDIEQLERILVRDEKRKIRAIIPVHFAGQPVDLARLYELARTHGAYVIDDASHALGAAYADGRRTQLIGNNAHSDLTTFSFHPVKHVATGEGGAVTTADPMLAARLRQLRTHGIAKKEFIHAEQAFSTTGELNPWYYEMTELGFNYRLTDIQAALGVSQLSRLTQSITRRNDLARLYTTKLAETFDDQAVRPLSQNPAVSNAYHLYVVQIDFESYGKTRAEVMNALKKSGIGTQVHYIPVHLQPYYRERYRTKPGDMPNAERYYTHTLSLPMFPALTDDDVAYVVESLKSTLNGNSRG
jgi:UDP-4-amino-4,6-dideoxy-N-acetyl-beta-L-altrosamine transaminase